MKKIEKIRMKDVNPMKDREMKSITGGKQGGCCAYTTNWQSSGYVCEDSADAAEAGAGTNGWWCCGCSEAKKACNCG
jgi:natural product precursor